ncbi:hypothetical protein DDZ18_11265 [Marinicauda salina]|uniref:Uncharacterized protein n=1 Tax=Marinicauda salina TaxID=2135793 RepID=A0A2U2BRY0_9PROT|nr:FliH/SctL family protein [Marinicauda salina]PWE16771.1 hypothetical protein DDZ18_11265 [Marinicauda salina]
MTTAHKRYAFDRVFDHDGTVLRDGDRVKRMLTEAEAEERAAAAAKAALESEEAKSSAAAAEALRTIAGRAQAVLQRMDAESERMREEAARLAVAAARVIAGRALDRYAADTVEACAREALADLRGEPRLALRVTPSLVDELSQRLQDEADLAGFEGAVIVRGDEEVALGDCVLEWRSGAIERTSAEIEARIGEAVERWLARPRADAASKEDAPDDGDAATDDGAAA